MVGTSKTHYFWFAYFFSIKESTTVLMYQIVLSKLCGALDWIVKSCLFSDVSQWKKQNVNRNPFLNMFCIIQKFSFIFLAGSTLLRYPCQTTNVCICISLRIFSKGLKNLSCFWKLKWKISTFGLEITDILKLVTFLQAQM